MAKRYLGRLTDELRERARDFRRDPTAAEEILWHTLRNRKLAGYKFRRQVVIDRFIVDFCCLENKLVVEVDGEVHNFQIEQDADQSKSTCSSRFSRDTFYEIRASSPIWMVSRRK